MGVPARVLAGQLPGVHVVAGPGALPATTLPPPLSHVAVLVPPGAAAATTAMTETAQIAGATVVPVPGDDPRADPTAIAALSAAKPARVVAAGAGFGPPSVLAYRVAVAATGVQLPGGGQIVFPGHRLVALYGHPESPVLGALGQQDLPASIARAKQIAASYQALSRVPVVPAFEIIATVALGFPGPDGTYSGVSSVASLRPWVERATAAGFYVVLDLQPGRASLLDQARMYEPLLAMPNVGLALDAEWKLQPGQLPLRQIGSVSINEVNSVVRWLASLTAELRLPQKLLVLHQFQLSMIQDERRLDTSNGDLAIVIHMDGQGTQGVKQDTWNAVTAAAPPGVFFGWKNFFTKDQPMASPQDHHVKAPSARHDLVSVTSRVAAVGTFWALPELSAGSKEAFMTGRGGGGGRLRPRRARAAPRSPGRSRRVGLPDQARPDVRKARHPLRGDGPFCVDGGEASRPRSRWRRRARRSPRTSRWPG